MNKRCIHVADLRVGMYVRALDRPWTDTPFLFQGFVVEHGTDIEVLRALCREVVIDLDRSRPVFRHWPSIGTARTRGSRDGPKPESLRDAFRIRWRTREALDNLFRDVRLGRSVDTGEARQVVAGLVEEITADMEASL